jgi:hypothetical protein
MSTEDFPATRWSFPTQVNANAARLVACGVVIMGVTYVTTGAWWILGLLLYGFTARALAGPRWSPLGRLAVATAAHAWPPAPTAGAPKQFAQLIGVAFSASAVVAAAAGQLTLSRVIIAALVGAASLEAAAGVCVGCAIWGRAHRAGLVAEECKDCEDITARTAI